MSIYNKIKIKFYKQKIIFLEFLLLHGINNVTKKDYFKMFLKFFLIFFFKYYIFFPVKKIIRWVKYIDLHEIWDLIKESKDDVSEYFDVNEEPPYLAYERFWKDRKAESFLCTTKSTLSYVVSNKNRAHSFPWSFDQLWFQYSNLQIWWPILNYFYKINFIKHLNSSWHYSMNLVSFHYYTFKTLWTRAWKNSFFWHFFVGMIFFSYYTMESVLSVIFYIIVLYAMIHLYCSPNTFWRLRFNFKVNPYYGTSPKFFIKKASDLSKYNSSVILDNSVVNIDLKYKYYLNYKYYFFYHNAVEQFFFNFRRVNRLKNEAFKNLPKFHPDRFLNKYDLYFKYFISSYYSDHYDFIRNNEDEESPIEANIGVKFVSHTTLSCNVMLTQMFFDFFLGFFLFIPILEDIRGEEYLYYSASILDSAGSKILYNYEYFNPYNEWVNSIESCFIKIHLLDLETIKYFDAIII